MKTEPNHIKQFNARIAQTLLGKKVTGVLFDNENRATNIQGITLELDSGAVVNIHLEATGDHYEPSYGIDIHIRQPEDEEGKVFRL